MPVVVVATMTAKPDSVDAVRDACTKAIEAVHDQAWGQMVSLRGTDIVRVPFAEALSGLKVVPEERYHEAELLFG